MEGVDLSGEEWRELYRFSLERVESSGYADVRREIEAAASGPVFEEGSIEENERIRKEFGREVGKRTVRRKEPFEVLRAAVDVIWTRLVE
jgi:tRNA U54 and U55 pseudouridine synthase Pus10